MAKEGDKKPEIDLQIGCTVEVFDESGNKVGKLIVTDVRQPGIYADIHGKFRIQRTLREYNRLRPALKK